MASSADPEYHSQHPLSLDRGGSAAAWVRGSGRLVAVGAGVGLVAVLGGLAYRWNSAATERRAEGAFYRAQAAAGGAPQQAEAALREVATRYDGTRSGGQARLLLAQLLYDGGRYQDGLRALQQGSPPKGLATSSELMRAAGQEALGQGSAAAATYERLGSSSELPDGRKDELKAAAARAYQLGGDRQAALRLWEQLIASDTPSIADEARVRAGELRAVTTRTS